MKSITLSADEGLIEAAQRRAAADNTTIDALFRHWLAQYVSTGPHPDPEVRKQQAEKAMTTLREVQRDIRTGGRKFTREEMNERREGAVADWLAGAGGSAPDLGDIPRREADADGQLPANVHENFGEAMVEKHRREGQGMLRFREFERGLGDAGQRFSQRERYLLFLERESHLSDEGREQFLRFVRHERAYLHEYNLDALGITIPGDYDSD